MLSCPKIKKQLIIFCLIFLISSLGIFVLGAKDAQADFLGIFKGIKAIIGELLLFIQGLVGVIVTWLAGLGLGILKLANPQKAKLVQEGWKVTRDLTNMFFVLILLAIAFATILRIETYGMKSLLPKLIIAALLINFSLVFAGVVIDFSGVMTAFFISDGQVFFKDIASAMNLPKIMTTTAEEKGAAWQCEYELEDYGVPMPTEAACLAICPSVGTCTGIPTEAKIQTETDWEKLGDSYWSVIGSLFFSIIFTVVAAFVFGALAFLLLARILIIWFLLILAPIAWLFWVLPATRQLFSQWWNAFIKWVFFAPAAIFFIWLSVKSWSQFISPSGGSMVGGVKQIVSDEMLGSRLVPQIMEPEYFVQFLLVCGMLLGSLVVAQKMGIYGAQGAMGVAKFFGKGAAKWTGRRAQMAAARPSGALGKKLGRAGAWMKERRGLKTIGRLTGQISRGPRAFAEKERSAFAESEKKYGNWTSDNLKSQYKSVDARSKASIAKTLADRGDFKANDKLGFTEKDIENATQLTKRYEQHRNILKARPDLAPSVGENVKETVAGLKPADMEKIQSEALTNEVTKAIQEQLTRPDGRWRGSHLSKMAENNPKAFVEIKQEVIDPNKGTFRKDVETYIDSDVGKAIFGEPAEKKEIKTETPVGAGGPKISEEERRRTREELEESRRAREESKE